MSQKCGKFKAGPKLNTNLNQINNYIEVKFLKVYMENIFQTGRINVPGNPFMQSTDLEDFLSAVGVPGCPNLRRK